MGDEATARRWWEELLTDNFDRVRGMVALQSRGHLSHDEQQEALQRALIKLANNMIETFRGMSMGEWVESTRTLVKFACMDTQRRAAAISRHERSLDQPGSEDGEPGRWDADVYAAIEEQRRKQESAEHDMESVRDRLQSGDKDGVIGSSARANLRQVPSMIYWQGLARWGIRRLEGTREQWGRAVTRSLGTAIDDDGQTVNATASWWHASLPDPPPDWPESASLTLRADEADYLRERIRENCAGTMLAALVERRAPWTPVAFPWQLDAPELTETQRTLLAHAQRFSDRMHGAALLYNHELAKRRGDEKAEADYHKELEDWATAEADVDLVIAPLDELWPLLGDLGSRHSPQTRRFAADWAALTTDPHRVITDAALVARIQEREFEVKKRQARLSFAAAEETWRGAAGAGQLDYRWNSTQRQLLDIVTPTEA